MEKRFRPIILVLLTLIAIVVGVLIARLTGGPGNPAPADTGIPSGATDAVVDYVHDGDTLFLEDGRKVRLLGVDTPEVGENSECYGDEATALLRSLLPEGSHVRVVADVQPSDQYGRSLLFLFTDAGTNVNLELIEQGAAEAVVLEPNVLYANLMQRAEDTARADGVGRWGAC